MKWTCLVMWLSVAILMGMGPGCATTIGPVSDRDLTADIVLRLQNDPITRPFQFGVMVTDGVVTLRGNAPPKAALRARAISIVLATPGVKEAIDELYPPTDGLY